MTKNDCIEALRTIGNYLRELNGKVPTMSDAEYSAYCLYLREVNEILEGFSRIPRRL